MLLHIEKATPDAGGGGARGWRYRMTARMLCGRRSGGGRSLGRSAPGYRLSSLPGWSRYFPLLLQARGFSACSRAVERSDTPGFPVDRIGTLAGVPAASKAMFSTIPVPPCKNRK
jgi:hypothetical protein